MVFAKIVVKENYQKERDLVFRPLVRAYKRVNADCFMDNGNAVILGIVDNDGVFNEYLTGKPINYDNYVELGFGDANEFLISLKKSGLTKEQIDGIKNAINEYVFNEKNLNYDEIMEDALDRSIELEAYEKGFSYIDPYDKENPNAYKNFLYKCELLNQKNVKSK